MGGQIADISAEQLEAGQFVGVLGGGGSHALNSTTVAGFRANRPVVGDEDAFIKVLSGVILSDQSRESMASVRLLLNHCYVSP